jgi:hypothetical protein
MPALRKSLPLILALTFLGQSGSLQAEARHPGVGGRVLTESNPLASAHIYAYQLADFSLRKVLTDGQGKFLFQDLPAGLYKIIAHKAGFTPAVIMLTRTTAQAYQTLEVQLAQRQAGQGKDGDDYWAIRSRVPADVLHQIEVDEKEGDFRVSQFENPFRGIPVAPMAALAGNFKTEMQTLMGVDQIAASGSQMSGAGLGVKGQLGNVQVDVHGRFLQFSPDAGFQPSAGGGTPGMGQASSVAIDLARGPGSRVSIVSFNNRMNGRSESGDWPVDLQHYGVNYSQDVGQNGRGDFSAHYTFENNFHRQALLGPVGIPETSRTWKIEGSYTEHFSDRNTLQTGVRYREREFDLGAEANRLAGRADLRQALSSVDLFSRGGLRVQPAVLMEYGLYSTLSDGSLALTPQGGVVFQINSDWQFGTSAAHRVYKDQPILPDFLPTLFEQRDLCEQGSEACYQMNLTRKVGDDDSLTFGAVQRRIGDTLRVYFSDDFFDRSESLYLVRGDTLPELRVGFQHKLSPKIVTKLDSSLATGGGGVFVASDGQRYENRVRYLVTSLDTKFLGTSTGVFVGFRHLEQQLAPMSGLAAGGGAATQMDFERLQLAVNQNLNILLDLASDWVVQLNMELSRGIDPTTRLASDTIRRRILGGIAVKF